MASRPSVRCPFYGSPEGCIMGSNCVFSHDFDINENSCNDTYDYGSTASDKSSILDENEKLLKKIEEKPMEPKSHEEMTVASRGLDSKEDEFDPKSNLDRVNKIPSISGTLPTDEESQEVCRKKDIEKSVSFSSSVPMNGTIEQGREIQKNLTWEPSNERSSEFKFNAEAPEFVPRSTSEADRVFESIRRLLEKIPNLQQVVDDVLCSSSVEKNERQKNNKVDQPKKNPSLGFKMPVFVRKENMEHYVVSAKTLGEVLMEEDEKVEDINESFDEEASSDDRVEENPEPPKSTFNVRAPEFVPWNKTYQIEVAFTTPYCPNSEKYVPAKFIPLCPCFEWSGECFDANCSLRHGYACVVCENACLDPFDVQQWNDHMLECYQKQMDIAMKGMAKKKIRGKICGICMESIAENNHRFGLLTGCRHPFCLRCIRLWRQSFDGHMDTETVRKCPTCRVHSDFVIPSYIWPDTDLEKQWLIAFYKKNAANKVCKYYKGPGRNSCPFEDNCFFKHELPNGAPENKRGRSWFSRNWRRRGYNIRQRHQNSRNDPDTFSDDDVFEGINRDLDLHHQRTSAFPIP